MVTEVEAPIPSSPSASRAVPAELAARIEAWVDDCQPSGAVERDLVERAAGLSWALDRVDRCEAASTAQRVRAAALGRRAERAAEVCSLARKLFYMSGKRSAPGSGPDWDDDPPVFVAALERSTEGARWMIERWTEIKRLIDQGAAWTFADQYRLIRLLGKRPVDAVDDPELNAIVLAWEAVEEDWGVSFWNKAKELTPSDDPAFNAWRQWRALGPVVASPEAGWALIRSIVDRELGRLAERLAILEEVEEADARWEADRALFAADNGAERLRRHRSALTRDLLRTLDAVAKLRKAQAPPKPSKQASSEPRPPEKPESENPERPSPSILLPLGEGGRRSDEGRRVRETASALVAPDPHQPEIPSPSPGPSGPPPRVGFLPFPGGEDFIEPDSDISAPSGPDERRNPPRARCPWRVPPGGLRRPESASGSGPSGREPARGRRARSAECPTRRIGDAR